MNASVPQCIFFSYQDKNTLFGLQVYNLFGLFWALFFVSALGEMVLAGAYAGWYYTWDKKNNLATFPVAESVGRTLR